MRNSSGWFSATIIAQHLAPHFHSLFVALAFVHRQASLGVQKRGEFRVEPVLIFDIGEMRGIELYISRTWDVICKEASVRRRRSGIIGAGDHQSWHADAAQFFAEIEIANGGATRSVTIGF